MKRQQDAEAKEEQLKREIELEQERQRLEATKQARLAFEQEAMARKLEAERP